MAKISVNRRKPGSKRRSGFSLLEAMVSAGVLGIGLAGLIDLHSSSIRGMRRSRDLGIGQMIAAQASEEIALYPIEAFEAAPLDACDTVTEGCKSGNAAHAYCTRSGGSGMNCGAAFSNPKPAGCSFWVGENGNMRDSTGATPYSSTAFASSEMFRADRRFRIDLVIRPHPEPRPAVNGFSYTVDVFVCWMDEAGFVHEVRTGRLVSPQ